VVKEASEEGMRTLLSQDVVNDRTVIPEEYSFVVYYNSAEDVNRIYLGLITAKNYHRLEYCITSCTQFSPQYERSQALAYFIEHKNDTHRMRRRWSWKQSQLPTISCYRFEPSPKPREFLTASLKRLFEKRPVLVAKTPPLEVSW